MPYLIANAFLYGLILSAVLAFVMLTSFLIAPDMWVGDYPPDIKAKYGEMGARARRWRPLVALLFFGSVIVIVMLSLRALQMMQGEAGFRDYFLSSFITLMVFNLFDLLIIDWLVFVKIQPKSIVLQGTEGKAGYKNYAFHLRGFLIGIGFSAVGALVFALIALALFNTF